MDVAFAAHLHAYKVASGDTQAGWLEQDEDSGLDGCTRTKTLTQFKATTGAQLA
jgi:hypothetical protein